jgi:hypothetical protein
MLVPVGSVVRAGNGQSAYPGVIGRAIDIVGHLHVFVLVVEPVDRSANGIGTTRCVRFEGQVNNSIDTLEKMGVLRSVGINEISDLYTFDLVAIAVGVRNVSQHQVKVIP